MLSATRMRGTPRPLSIPIIPRDGGFVKHFFRGRRAPVFVGASIFAEGGRRSLRGASIFAEGGRRSLRGASIFAEGGRRSLRGASIFVEGGRRSLRGASIFAEGGRRSLRGASIFVEGARQRYSGKITSISVVMVAYASSARASKSTFSSSRMTSESFGFVRGWRGVKTVQQSS